MIRKNEHDITCGIILSYVWTLIFIPTIKYNHGGNFRMQTSEEIYLKHIFICSVATIY
jgi:hypothetical protein